MKSNKKSLLAVLMAAPVAGFWNTTGEQLPKRKADNNPVSWGVGLMTALMVLGAGGVTAVVAITGMTLMLLGSIYSDHTGGAEEVFAHAIFQSVERHRHESAK